jgi:branched-chain amino acid transport system permease protein
MPQLRLEIVLAAVLGVGALLLGLFGSKLWLNFGAEALIWALFVISLNLLVGYGGMVSFGHAAYFGLGAYGAGLLAAKLGMNLFLAALLGVALAALIALLFGLICVRRSKVYFAMLTLALAQLCWAVAFRWNDVTGGDQGINGLPAPELGALLGTSNQRAFYFLCLILAVLGVMFVARLVTSPTGLVFRAIKQNSERVQFLGVRVARVQLAIFVIAGAMAGLAGALFAYHTRGLFPDYLYWTKGAEALNMLVLGGMNSLMGPVLGAVVLLLINQEATSITPYWSLITGLMLGGLIMFAPGGLAALGARVSEQLRGQLQKRGRGR